jgi:nitrogen regulatory protein P-II 2
MQTHARRLLVLITEGALERSLVKDIRAFGALGYTIHDVRGAGRHGERPGDWEADRSIEIKVICDPAVAERLAEHVLQTYSEDYSLSLYLADVAVFRKEKY